jgi:hypothetical protein
MAAIAESLRFFAVMFLAFNVGALLSSGASSLLRYAAAPQLLFAAGFFFLWLDPERYGQYRPLLGIGKAASIVCFVPFAADLVRDSRAATAFGVPYLGLAFACFILVVDIASISILLLTKPGIAPPAKPSNPGQGPDDIEKVEGL